MVGTGRELSVGVTALTLDLAETTLPDELVLLELVLAVVFFVAALVAAVDGTARPTTSAAQRAVAAAAAGKWRLTSEKR